MTLEKSVYHEKQRLGHCAIHTLNNIFQERWVTYDMISDVAHELHVEDMKSTGHSSLMNPFMSWLPFYGDFDIACIQRLLQIRGAAISKHIVSIEQLPEINEVDSFAYIVNQRSIFGRHWFAVLRVGDIFYNMDSKLKAPEVYNSMGQVVSQLLLPLLETQRAHVFCISRF